MITFDPATLLVYGLLTVAVLAVWLPPALNPAGRLPLWALLLGLSAVAGMYHGILGPVGAACLAGLGLLCRVTAHPKIHRCLRIVSGAAVAGLTVALFAHAVPGFNNPLVFDGFSFGAGSADYSKHWNFDKAAAGLILLACFGQIAHSGHDWRALARRAYPVAIVTITLTVLSAWAAGYIQPELTLTPVFFVWAWANLFFTCIAEEMLFRGFAQKHLTALTDNNTCKLAAVVIMGVLFGLAHFAGGWTYVLLASIAGIGYGFAYHLTGRIESAVLTHFLLNSVHLLFFTYPSIKNFN